MKNSLLQENNEIIKEFNEIRALLQPSAKLDTLNKCLHNFRNLTTQWTHFIQTSESKSKSYQIKSAQTQKVITKYRQVSLKNKLKIAKAETQEIKIIKKEEKIASHLAIFPKLWKTNLRQLKRKSLSWRVTPFACPQYDQELEFMNTKRDRKEETLENIDVSAEFERVMQEIDKQKKEHRYRGDKISIDKSFSGWKSEYDSEGESRIGDVSEIKNAISILQRANLLRPESRELLSKISELARNPEQSDNLVLFLQLININNSQIPSFTNQDSEHDVRIDELLDATSFLSNVGPKMLEESLVSIGSLNMSIAQYVENHKKTMSLGKNSTKDMTEQLIKN